MVPRRSQLERDDPGYFPSCQCWQALTGGRWHKSNDSLFISCIHYSDVTLALFCLESPLTSGFPSQRATNAESDLMPCPWCLHVLKHNSGYGLSQREEWLLCIPSFHWLSPHPEWSLKHIQPEYIQRPVDKSMLAVLWTSVSSKKKYQSI